MVSFFHIFSVNAYNSLWGAFYYCNSSCVDKATGAKEIMSPIQVQMASKCKAKILSFIFLTPKPEHLITKLYDFSCKLVTDTGQDMAQWTLTKTDKKN